MVKRMTSGSAFAGKARRHHTPNALLETQEGHCFPQAKERERYGTEYRKVRHVTLYEVKADYGRAMVNLNISKLGSC